MSAKHTEGPWMANGYNIYQSGRKGTRHVAEVAYTGPHHTPPHEYPASCRLQDEANARLIAAAPDLLEALGSLSRHRPLMGSTGEYREGQLDLLQSIERIAKAAIAKATGEGEP